MMAQLLQFAVASGSSCLGDLTRISTKMAQDDDDEEEETGTESASLPVSVANFQLTLGSAIKLAGRLAQMSHEAKMKQRLQTIAGIFENTRGRLRVLRKKEGRFFAYGNAMIVIGEVTAQFHAMRIALANEAQADLRQSMELIAQRRGLLQALSLEEIAARRHEGTLQRWMARLITQERLSRKRRQLSEEDASDHQRIFYDATLHETYRQWFKFDFNFERACLLSSFVRSPPRVVQATSSSNPSERASAEDLRSLLAAGLADSSESSTTQRIFVAATKRFAGDPLIPYAHGLVCLEQLDHDHALFLLKTAYWANPNCPPLGQIIIRLHAATDEHYAAAARLHLLGESLHNIQNCVNCAGDCRQLAIWMGRMTGYLLKMTPAQGLSRERLERRRLDTRASLSPTLREAFDEGQHGFEREYRAIAESLRQKRDERIAKLTKAAMDRVNAATEKLDASTDEKEEIQLKQRDLHAAMQAQQKEIMNRKLQLSWRATQSEATIKKFAPILANPEAIQGMTLESVGELRRQFDSSQTALATANRLLTNEDLKSQSLQQSYLKEREELNMQEQRRLKAETGARQSLDNAKRELEVIARMRLDRLPQQDSVRTYFPVDFSVERERLLALARLPQRSGEESSDGN
jgi:hypothetical protein